jgi:hypothetical protein
MLDLPSKNRIPRRLPTVQDSELAAASVSREVPELSPRLAATVAGMNRFTCLVGRTEQFPDRELVYWFEREIEDEDNIVVRHPGTDRGNLVGRRENFREYGDAVRESLRLNPLPGPTTIENQERHRDRLLAELDRQWDIWGRQREQVPAQAD